MFTNNLGGTIPEVLGNALSELKSLGLSDNRLTGALPESLGNLDELVALDLHENHLSGTIPPTLTLLGSLEDLNLYRNNMKGTIPEFNKYARTEFVYLSQNQLTGSVPKSLTTKYSLKQLNLRRNQLSGSVATELGSLEDLDLINLSENLMTGTIPTELGNAKSLESLDLSFNGLGGPIPSELGRAPNLNYLYLERNQLTGSIPSEILSMSEIRKIDLSSNLLNGTVPSEMRGLSNLRTFKIQNNSITGNLDALVCDNDVFFDSFSADCGADDSSSPEVTCTCCHECCNDMSGCPFDDGLEACNRDHSVWHSDWTPCECERDFDFDGIDFSLSCFNQGRKCCNTEASDCAFLTDGYRYTEEGEQKRYWERYEYFMGEHEGRSVVYDEIVGEGCTVAVDGQPCLSCVYLECFDGSSSVQVICDNVEEGMRFEGCSESADGVLQILHKDFNLGNCPIHNPGFCSGLISYQEREAPGYSCSCSDDGLTFSCDPGYELCYPGSSEEQECYSVGIGLVYEDEGSAPTSESYEYTYTSSSSYLQASVVLKQDLVDDSCTVLVDDQQCNSCEKLTCPGDIESVASYSVDCSNISEHPSTFNACDSASFPESGILQTLVQVYTNRTLAFKNNIAMCTAVMENVQQTNVECECSKDGKRISCESGGCSNCFTTGTESEPSKECFSVIQAYHDMDHNINATQTFSGNNVYRYTSASSFEGVEVFLTTNILTNSCAVLVDGVRCNSCALSNCDDPDSSLHHKVTVDCANLVEFDSPVFDSCNTTTWETSGVLQVLQPTPLCTYDV